MAERCRANFWSFFTGVGPKVVQSGCHRIVGGQRRRTQPTGGRLRPITAVGGGSWLSSCRGATAVVVTFRCVECPNPPACQCSTSLCQSMFGRPEPLAKRHWMQSLARQPVNAAKMSSCLTTGKRERGTKGVGRRTVLDAEVDPLHPTSTSAQKSGEGLDALRPGPTPCCPVNCSRRHL